MAVTEVSSSPKMFDAYVENISGIGWNGQGGSLPDDPYLEDPDNGVEIDLPAVGTTCWF